MKKPLLVILLALSILFRSEIHAQSEKRSIPQKTTVTGNGALQGKENALKWGIATGGIVAFGTIFGLILYLASTDPTSFAHHAHMH